MNNFDHFFKTATAKSSPFPYQRRFATASELPSFLSVPTGVGKTATTVLGWLWRRRFSDPKVQDATPRRLVFCLPMRTLVEQTRDACVSWLNGLAEDGLLKSQDVRVHVLMGGSDASDWDIRPEQDAIIIGTQDMLISRALNRGYGMGHRGRYRWPLHFGMLNNDCFWVLDETQLMGSGLFTTAQLDLFGNIWNRAKPCHFLWMSATIVDGFLQTFDRKEHELEVGRLETLEKDDLQDEGLTRRLNADKRIQLLRSAPSAKRVVEQHQTGRITLVIFNTVPSAVAFRNELSEQLARDTRVKDAPPDVCLLHGRFRPRDRKRELDRIKSLMAQADLETGDVANRPGLIVVSTQVIEAGFDLSSVRLWSEVAPWPSVVQRLGRLNRAGLQSDALASFWKPKEDKDRENHKDSPNAKRIGPYEKTALKIAEDLIRQVVQRQQNGVAYRTALEEVSRSEKARKAIEVVPDVVIRPNDFFELFGTEADMSGGFTDVSQFVRSADRNVDLQVFWRELKNSSPAADESWPLRVELCSLPVYELRRLVGGKFPAYEWNPESRAWESRRSKEIQPGMTLLLPLTNGCYSDQLGWTGLRTNRPSVMMDEGVAAESAEADCDSLGRDWVSLFDHLADAKAEAALLANNLSLQEACANALAIAARRHDWGKSVGRWQEAAIKSIKAVRAKIETAIEYEELPEVLELLEAWLLRWTKAPSNENWAKFPNIRDAIRDSGLELKKRILLGKTLVAAFRPEMRHEAASALAAWDQWRSGDNELSALAVYLIACHHGKVRTVMRKTRGSSEAFGLSGSDRVQPVNDELNSERLLNFDCCRFGASGSWNDTKTVFEMSSPSWIQMVHELLGSEFGVPQTGSGVIPDGEPKSLGPIVLSYLEALICVADIRASQKPGRLTR